jgi:hypothetical protein
MRQHAYLPNSALLLFCFTEKLTGKSCAGKQSSLEDLPLSDWLKLSGEGN